MLRVVLKSLVVTVAVILVGQVISYSGRMATGRTFTMYVFFMNSFLPLVTAFPASMLIFWQQQRLQLAHAALKHAHEQLARKAAHDGLTGLLNREAFFAQLDASGALLLIDADNFKSINDTFGHAAGDTALRLIAEAIVKASDPTALIARIGGEEFAVFVPGATAEAAVAVAECLAAEVRAAEFCPMHDRRHSLSVSVGIALHAPGDDLQQSFRLADANLYKAKSMGKNLVMAPAKPQLSLIG